MTHSLAGRKQSPEHIAKRVESVRIAKSLWDAERDALYRQRVSASAKGRVGWLKGKKGADFPEYFRKIMSESHKGIQAGENHPMFGKYHSEDAKEKNRQAHLGIKQSPEVVQKRVDARAGYSHSEEAKKKIRETNIKTWAREEIRAKTTGENSPSWLGGISFEPYPTGWTRLYKSRIRERDGYRCMNCGVEEKSLNANLSVHHIDYVKQNISPGNLISLCKPCHVKTNYRREYWTAVFRNVLDSQNNKQLIAV